jgi:hypothetical protein
MDTLTSDFVRAGSLDELKAKGWIVVHGRHRPVLLVYEFGHFFALDRGSVEPVEVGLILDERARA